MSKLALSIFRISLHLFPIFLEKELLVDGCSVQVLIDIFGLTPYKDIMVYPYNLSESLLTQNNTMKFGAFEMKFQ